MLGLRAARQPSRCRLDGTQCPARCTASRCTRSARCTGSAPTASLSQLVIELTQSLPCRRRPGMVFRAGGTLLFDLTGKARYIILNWCATAAVELSRPAGCRRRTRRRARHAATSGGPSRAEPFALLHACTWSRSRCGENTLAAARRRERAADQSAESRRRETPDRRHRSCRRGPRATVRTYRHGLGDCHLVTLSAPGSNRRDYPIMIDCGVILGTPTPAR